MRKLSTSESLFLGSILLLAFALRAYRIGFQSLWGDEAYSVWSSALPLLQIPSQVATTGNLPPLYHLMLHFWQGMAGSSETAVRFMSLIFGVLSIPMAFKVMERLHSREAGLFAALMGAGSSFWVYYSQETKMYSQVAFLALLSSYLFLRIFDERIKRAPWFYIAYSAVSAAAVCTHYFTVFVLLAQGVYLLLRRDSWRTLGSWAASQCLAVALFLPWAIYALPTLSAAGSAVERGSISLGEILPQVLRAFASGTSMDPNWQPLPWVLAGALLLVLVGFVTVSGRARIYLLVTLVLPILGVYAVSFLPHPGWERYFMAASPAFYGLVSAGLASLYQRHHALGAASLLILLPSTLSLTNYYFDPQFARPDYRSEVNELVASSGPGDGVIVNGPEDFPAFFYYFENRLPYYVLSNRQVSNPSDAAAFLGALGYSGLWLVKYMPPDYDPNNAIEDWLKRNAFPLETRWVENVTFTYYSLPRDATAPGPGAGVSANFEQGIHLLGDRVDIVRRPGGNLLQLTLLWKPDQKLDSTYKVFVHVLDGAGHVVGQHDSEPVEGLSPTNSWKPGDTIVDRCGVLLPQTFEAEGAQLEVGLYDSKTGARLQVLHKNGQPVDMVAAVPIKSVDTALALPIQ